MVRRWPALTGYCFATLFFWLSLTPSLLPRPWIMQGLLGGITGIAGYGVGSLISTLVRSVARRRGQSFSKHLRKRSWQFIPVVLLAVSVSVALRGVLFGLALRRWPPLGATAFSSLMFGCWHILSSLRLNTEKPALTSLLGPSGLGAALADLGTVVFTGLGGAVFCELRRRSGSLLVPMSFHWATNALGYVFGFLLRVGVVPEL